ncbi:MAG: AraC family transcriptional regulator ligand-binding domain-containing protein [Bauldia litoralis]
MHAIPVISNRTLHGLPELIRGELGERVLSRAVRMSGVNLELIEAQNGFIPHAAVVSLVETAARAAGEVNFGLMMAPQMNVKNYGCWGRYVMGADTLGQAIGRCIDALGYHSVGDTMALAVVGEEARYSYGFALAGVPGYDHLASVAAGVLMSLCTNYISTGWRPLRIELDIARPARAAPFEDLFRCPVVFNAPTMTVVFDKRHLGARRAERGSHPITTLADLARDRHGIAPIGLPEVMAEQIRLQVLAGATSIDATARSMDLSVRTLQRELNRQGTDFRTMVNAARARRAEELLRGSTASITAISTDLGYSSPANFARAFRNATGLGPTEFRAVG